MERVVLVLFVGLCWIPFVFTDGDQPRPPRPPIPGGKPPKKPPPAKEEYTYSVGVSESSDDSYSSYDNSYPGSPEDYDKTSSEDSPEDTKSEHDYEHRSHYCPPCLVWKECGYPCKHECHPKKKKCKCRPGCYCPGDLKLNNDGKCVSPYLCPRKMHKACCYGKMYTTCGNDCVESCGAEVCTMECKEGCFCLRGTKNINGVCQPPYKCRTCAAGRVYQKCGYRCDEICGCYQDQYTSAGRYCEEGCFCPKGKRIVGGVCRPERECDRGAGSYYK